MLVAITSDIHGNRHAFEAVIADAEIAGAQELWCLGDLVGYGAEPDACVDLARAHCSVCLAGNHDLAVTGRLSTRDFSAGAALAVEWTRDAIGGGALEFLRSVDPSALVEGVALYHASPRDPVWEYVLSPLAAELCLDVAAERISFIGHSHVALSFHRPDGDTATGSKRRAGEVADLTAGAWLLNPGSAGQPRDNDPRAAWLMFDTEARTAQWHRVEYDIAGAQSAIRTARLPESLAERLRHGH